MNVSTQIPEPSISEIRDEIQSVLSSEAFRHSRGSARLLRYMCNSVLLNGNGQVTEYTIAVDLFGKPVDFKENKDAAVRVEVHRLRKRLGQFYEQEGVSHRVQILIPVGKYVPEFVFRPGAGCEEPAQEPARAVPELISSAESGEKAAPVLPAGRSRKWWIGTGIGFTALVLLLLWILEGRNRNNQALETFWKPVISSPAPILLCVGNVAGGKAPFGDKPQSNNPSLSLMDLHRDDSELVFVADAAAVARFAGLMGAKGKSFAIASQTDVTFADLQSSPTILVGLMNNEWTRRLIGKLRFFVDHPAPGKLMIRDRNDAKRTDWVTDFTRPYLEIAKDYALVVRVFDPKTEQMAVMAGGISIFGTLAAGDFLTDGKEMRKLEAFAPKDWKRKNVEVVLSTDVIRGKSGPPKVEAAYFW